MAKLFVAFLLYACVAYTLALECRKLNGTNEVIEECGDGEKCLVQFEGQGGILNVASNLA